MPDGVRMGGSMADKRAVEQLKYGQPASAGCKTLGASRSARDFLAKSALSRQRRFPVAD
jgi:hypothetical protein